MFKMRANTKNMEKIIADVTESPSKPSFSAGCATIWQTGGGVYIGDSLRFVMIDVLFGEEIA